MAYPTKPSLSTSYTAVEQSQGDGTFPGQELDVDLAALKASIESAIDFIKNVTRSDGKLANQSVTRETLATDILLGFDAPATWESGKTYIVPNTVFFDSVFYVCTIEHTASLNFATDLASGRWLALVDFGAETADAEAAADAAAASASAAAGSAANSAASASAAAVSEGNAAASENAAEASEAAASISRSNAAVSASSAAGSASAALNSANAAAGSASTATTKASEAATSASNAAGSATSAANSAAVATTKASAAATSETNAANSATAAAGSASTATTKASEAAASQSAAAGSASAAAGSATEASASATAAAGSASTAASEASDAEDSASAAAGSATNAANSATAAAGSATNAANSASAAATSATNAAGSASTATTKASEAATSETNAANSATAAAGSASMATTKASEAYTSASAAATSATNAASSATAAAGSATNAANSAAAAASALDSFDDRYLGSKTSDPTVDNDGNPLVTGALYYNSSAGGMRVYDGVNWIEASSAGNVSLLRYEYTATSGQTSFSGTDSNGATMSYVVGNVIVALNGVILDDGADYTATSGSSVVLASGATAGDVLTVIAFKSFVVADMVPASTGGTFSGPVAFGNGVNVTGNIAVSGTVDGRDLAADGSKLDGIEAGATGDQTGSEIKALYEAQSNTNAFTDAEKSKLSGIEAGATADQTASEILTAIKTVDGSGSGLDADLLDGVQGSSYLRSDAADTFTSLSGTSLTLGSGVTLSEASDRADLLLVKSSTAGWAGLQIQNTSNEGLWSFMTDGTTGGIYDDMSNAWHIQFIDGGETLLYHAGSEKLNTTSGGVTVTGTVTATAFSGSGAGLTNLPDPTTAQVGSATAGLSTGAVGSYALLYYYGTGSTEGTTRAGSSLYGAGFHRSVFISADGDSSVYVTRSGTAQSGTWRCMGRTNFDSSNTYSRVTLWMRIS